MAWGQQAIRDGEASVEEVERKLRKTLQKEAPALTSTLDKFLGNRSVGIATWIMVVLMIIGYVQDAQQPQLTPEMIEQFIEQAEIEDGESGMAPAPRQTPPRPTEGKPARE